MGRLLVDANDRWRGTQPCSVDAQDLASGNDRLCRQQTLGTEARTTTMGRQRQSQIGQQQSLEVFLQATASGCMSGLSLNGRLDGAARYTEGPLQQSFVSASDRPIAAVRFSMANVCYAELSGRCPHAKPRTQ